MNVLGHFNYWIVIFLMMVGFYTIISRGNLVKKVAGLTIFQTSVFIFFISLGKVIGGTPPILVGEISHGPAAEAGAVEHGEGDSVGPSVTEEAAGAGDATEAAPGIDGALGATGEEVPAAGEGGSTTVDGVVYSNPLPHVLILTAIVVGIATTALALALVVRINESYGSIEEDEIHEMELQLGEGP